MKAKVDKLEINILVNIPTSSNNLETSVDNLDVDKLKAVPVDLKKLSDAVDKQVAENTKVSTLNTKVKDLEKKILPDETTLIHTNQYNSDKQNLEKKVKNVDKKIPGTSGIVTATVLNTKTGEVGNKIHDISSLVKKKDYDAKIEDIEGKYLTTADYNKFLSDILDAKIKKKN